MQPGDQVRRISTGHLGVLLAYLNDELVEVAFASGKTTLHLEGIEPAAKDVADELIAGAFGHAETQGDWVELPVVMSASAPRRRALPGEVARKMVLGA